MDMAAFGEDLGEDLTHGDDVPDYVGDAKRR